MNEHDERRETQAEERPPDGAQRPRGEGGFTEEFKVSGEAVVAKIKELVREGNVRRITIKNDEGHTLIEVPLTIGVIGTVLLPVWAAIGAIAALAANLTIAVDRRRDGPDAGGGEESGAAPGAGTGTPPGPSSGSLEGR